MSKSPEELAHIEWLGYVQPVGLVVSIPAMLEAQCYVNKNIMSEHARFLECLVDDDNTSPQRKQGNKSADHSLALRACIRDLREFVQAVLGWESDDLVDVPARQVLSGEMAKLEVVLPQYNETLRPTHAVPVFRPEDDQNPWLLLIQELPASTDLDEAGETDSSRHWNASPQAKFERLLRETGVPIGLLSNRRSFRLVYSPRGETSGYATFNVDEMAQVAGRPMFAALHMLLSSERMFSMGDNQRLPAILSNSRKYQNTVSTELAEQVLAALYELMRGFQAANDVRNGELLSGVLARDPNQVYSGLLTVLMRLVFILYAEDRDLLSSDPIYSNHYSVTGLFNRLREDDGRFPDTMDQRFGAWSQLVTLFRLVYEGGQHSDFKLPARKGYLFDPERYPFLEGRTEYKPEAQASESPTPQHNPKSQASESTALPLSKSADWAPQLEVAEATAAFSTGLNTDHSLARRARSETGTTVPRVSDGTVFRVLKNLLILDGERLSYRTLDVEQIGSVYETVMGFNLQVAAGKSIAIKPVKSHGAPATINLDELLETPGKDRAKWLKENADQKVGTADAKLLKAATNLEELLTALDRKIAKKVTPRVVPAGAIVLQPSDERRRSGSHYTPRSLTEPIVRTTLEPILAQLVGATNTSPSTTSPKRKREDNESTTTPEDHSLARRACIDTPQVPEVYKPTAEDKRRYTKGELDARVRLSQKAVEYARAAREVGTPHPSQILDLKVCDPAMGSGAFLVEACRQLGDELIKAWYAHGAVPSDIPADEDEVLYARRLVAQRCLYGVDKNFMAVDLAKLALWLVTLAKDHAFTFLDHSLRSGDSLVGLSREQIIGFHWEPKKQKKFGEELIQRRLDRATEARAKILNAREDVAYRDQEQKMALAEESLRGIRLLGDACVSAFFNPHAPLTSPTRKRAENGSDSLACASGLYEADASQVREKGPVKITKRMRQDRVEQLFGIASAYLEKFKDKQMDFELHKSLQSAADSLLEGEHPIPAFHWEIEFPEVFARENGGFDAFVGNPPFAGKNTLVNGNREGYLDWLKSIHEGAHGNSDLVAHFFRRTFDCIRRQGALGLIATNTIRQGDTRSTGLRWIRKNSGTIYGARRRMRWPGQAAVVVSVVYICKGELKPPYQLDQQQVYHISAYLFPLGTDDDPFVLQANDNLCSNGVKIYGTGFTFDHGNVDASPIARMNEIVESDKSSHERVFPYLGGEELNSSPTQSPDRFVIHFGEMSLEQAEAWPELLSVVRQKVKPQRDKVKDERCRTLWWQYERPRTEFFGSITSPRVLALSRVGNHASFCFVSSDTVFSDSLVVFRFDDFGRFAMMQSRPHEFWARFFSSSMKDDLRYTSSDCFETFPFPDCLAKDVTDSGKTYSDFRRDLMQTNSEGLTDTYNRFHDPHEQSEGIFELRRLHGLMDAAVLRAYGWDDLAESARCEFLLDYEEEEDDSLAGASGSYAGDNTSPTRKRGKKKPWRLRWPDEFRDEVLARLLELNEQRHKEELLVVSSQLLEKKDKKKAAKVAKKSQPTPLLDDQIETVDDEVVLTDEDRMTLAILAAWGEGTLVDRLLFGESVVLWRNDEHRRFRAYVSENRQKRLKPAISMKQIIGRAAIKGWLTQVDRGGVEFLKLIMKPSPLGDLSPSESEKVDHIRDIVRRETEAVNSVIEITEDSIRASTPFAVARPTP